jgi:hypothetical protein
MTSGEDAALHSLVSEDAMRCIVAQSEGLSGAEAARRLAAHGPNRLPERIQPPERIAYFGFRDVGRLRPRRAPGADHKVVEECFFYPG